LFVFLLVTTEGVWISDGTYWIFVKTRDCILEFSFPVTSSLPLLVLGFLSLWFPELSSDLTVSFQRNGFQQLPSRNYFAIDGQSASLSWF
jgi:hypothetical protein